MSSIGDPSTSEEPTVTERPGDEDLLTLQEAADTLKVHYMTAYRWVRRGDLPAFKAGGRLRVRVTDLDGFIAAREVDVALPTGGDRRTDWPIHVERLYAALLAGEGAEAFALVRKVVADGAPAGDVYISLITPALHRIGEDWASGKIGVAEEHRATEIAYSLISRLSEHFRRRGPSRGTAVTLTPPEELHALPAAMVADFLRAGGYDVHHLGPNVPLHDLDLFLGMVPTDVVCVSVTRQDLTDGVLDGLVKIANAHPGTKTVVGGQGIDAAVANELGAVHVASLADLTAELAKPPEAE
jgi:MerR family transcriptional regulator, light-induced transcriptional regulator